MLAIGVRTAVADVSTAILTARLGKPLAATLLDQAESARLLPARGAHTPDRDGDGDGDGDGERGGEGDGERSSDRDGERRVPAYSYPESAARALGHAARYREWRDAQHGQVPDLDGIDAAGARALVSAFLEVSPDGGWLTTADATALLASYQIRMVTTRTAASEAGVLAAAAELGGHVVLKAEVGGLVHKTDASAVKLDLRTAAEVADAYANSSGPSAMTCSRVLVQPMLAGGVETIIGVIQEPVFGPLVVFGLGGVATEVLGDHAARLAPLTDADADAVDRRGPRGAIAVRPPRLAGRRHGGDR